MAKAYPSPTAFPVSVRRTCQTTVIGAGTYAMHAVVRACACCGRELDYTLAIFLAELRSTRRSTVFWLIAAGSIGATGLVYAHYAGLHSMLAGRIPLGGHIAPRFLLPQIGAPLLALLLVATVFLASNAPTRDRRDRMAEALDTKPMSNVSLVAGRALAVAAAAWTPIAAIAVLIQLTGQIAVGFDLPIGAPLEGWSLAAFLALDAPAALVLCSTAVVQLAIMLRSRLAAAAIGLGILFVLVWALSSLPAYLLPVASPVASYGEANSTLVPAFADGTVLAQRSGLLAFAAAALLFAAACHRRHDATHIRGHIAAGAVLTAVGTATLAALAWQASEGLRQRGAWLAVHRVSAVDGSGSPRLRHVQGEVRIVPGEALHLDITLHVDLDHASIGTLHFALNPGLVVERVEVDGATAAFRHDDGLLAVRTEAALAADRRLELKLLAHGRPDPDFAHLQPAVDWRQLAPSQMHLLGTTAAIFDPRYVALMPGTFWLPKLGTAVQASRENPGPSDWFTVDLQVEVPSDYTVAGPGCIETASGFPAQTATSGATRFHVRPSAPVSAVGMFASRFERRTSAAGRTRVDLLLNPRHAGNLDFFEDVAEALRTRLEDVFTEVAARGLPYPYECVTAVEVPASLRSYGGGWRMSSAMALPGVLPIRERGFPTAAYQRTFARPGLGEAKALVLESFLVADHTGAGPLEWLSHNLLLGQSETTGRGSDATRYVLHELLALALGQGSGRTQLVSARLFDLDARPHVFVAHAFGSLVPGLQMANQPLFWSGGQPLPDEDAWEYVATVPPAAYPDETAPVSATALALRGDAVARTIFDVLGTERTWSLLAELRRRHAGSGFGWDEVEAAAAALGLNIASLVGEWLDDPRLPGFQATPATVVRIGDDDQGQPRYGIRVHVRNGEPVPGVVRLSSDRHGFRFLGRPIPIPPLASVEVGVVAPAPPNQLWLLPGLSLNREPMRIGLSVVAASDDEEPLVGTRPSTWRPIGTEGVVVDDLAPGFSIEVVGADRCRLVSDSAKSPSSPVDGGMWQQEDVPGSWGKYRSTAAMASGDGRTCAVFAATIEVSGSYELEYHVPDRRIPVPHGVSEGERFVFGALGRHEVAVYAAEVEAVLHFDGSAAEPGWNKLGSFDLAAGAVWVAVSDKANGATVIADAIRWRPGSRTAGGETWLERRQDRSTQ